MAIDKLPFTVAFADEMHPDGIALARRLFERVLLWTDEDYRRWIEEADGICNRAKRVPSADLLASKRLRVVSKQGVGVDTVDLKACREKNITVCNTPGINAERRVLFPVAELSLGLALSLNRRISELDRRGEVNIATSVMGRSMYGKTIGLVGMGNIGRATADKFRAACSCSIVAYDPFAPATAWTDDDTRSGPLAHKRVQTIEEMLPEVDVLSLHLPLTNETRGLVGKEFFDQMKEGAILLNASRGGIVNEADLFEALRPGSSSPLAGAALDALETEPPTKEAYGNTLYTLDNVLLTPHIGAATHEMQSLSARTVVEQLASCLMGKTEGISLVQ
ncbi:hypothetical protein JCM10207_003708 [Rhodosporidiobolus poonsookiae]